MSIPGTDEPVLDDDDVALIVEALDSHEYWQLSDPTWRHSGAVILPGYDPQLWADRSALSGRERRGDRRDRAFSLPRGTSPPAKVV